MQSHTSYTVKKRLVISPSPAEMSLTKLSRPGIFPGCAIPAGDGKIANLFFSVLNEEMRRKSLLLSMCLLDQSLLYSDEYIIKIDFSPSFFSLCS